MSKRFTIMVTGAVVASLIALPAGSADAKKKKKPKPKPPAACAAFVPGEAGTGKPTVIVTDAATEAAPVEQKVTLDKAVTEGIADGATDTFNVQVDTSAADTGLYAKVTFPDRRDYDLELLYPDSSYAARSHGFNPVAEDPADGTQADMSDTGYGGETTPTSEAVLGIRTSDCGGWTIEIDNYLGEGGDISVTLWVGAVKNDPQAAGAEPHS